MNQIPPESIILARIIGIFIITCGLSALVKKQDWMAGVDRIRDNPASIYFIALAELAVGLTIVAVHPHFVSTWPIVITMIGLLMTVESIIYLVFTPHQIISKWVRFFNRPIWYNVCGVLSILLGLYLVLMSFGVQ